MIAYRCKECPEDYGPCILLVENGSFLPTDCPYETDIEPDWDGVSLEALTLGVRE